MTYAHQQSGTVLETPRVTIDASQAPILASARAVYHTFRKTHLEFEAPLGVAVDRNTFRGQLIFATQPILLPHECFVTLEQLQAQEPEADE
ncbi:MAG: hypothetical protein WA902_08075 [Thermosynechococcaceae cyanobacterium]